MYLQHRCIYITIEILMLVFMVSAQLFFVVVYMFHAVSEFESTGFFCKKKMLPLLSK